VVPERLYIWRSPSRFDAPPDFEIDASPVFAPYFERIGVQSAEIEPMAFEILVEWWLNDQIRAAGGATPEALARTGLVEALHGVRIVRSPSA